MGRREELCEDEVVFLENRANGRDMVEVDPFEHLSPHEFLCLNLRARGYDDEVIGRVNMDCVRSEARPSDMQSYSKGLLDAVRSSNIEMLHALSSQGVCMTACNKFCESVVHLACRRSCREVVSFILSKSNVDCLWLVDDKGRCPLHDACWRKSPDTEIVEMLLEKCCELIWLPDSRGCLPLEYTQRHDWPVWREFISSIMDRFWPTKVPPEELMQSLRVAAAASHSPLSELDPEENNFTRVSLHSAVRVSDPEVLSKAAAVLRPLEAGTDVSLDLQENMVVGVDDGGNAMGMPLGPLLAPGADEAQLLAINADRT